MTAIQVRGTTDPAEIAVVLAVLQRPDAAAAAPSGIAAWRERRRAALAGRATRRA